MVSPQLILVGTRKAMPSVRYCDLASVMISSWDTPAPPVGNMPGRSKRRRKLKKLDLPSLLLAPDNVAETTAFNNPDAACLHLSWAAVKLPFPATSSPGRGAKPHAPHAPHAPRKRFLLRASLIAATRFALACSPKACENETRHQAYERINCPGRLCAKKENRLRVCPPAFG